MNVSIFNTQRRFTIDHESAIQLARRVILAENTSFDEVTLQFVGKKKICQLHSDYFDDPSFTDCISFPMDNVDSSGYSVLGEVFVCPEAAYRFVSKHGGDLYEEISLYTVHGLLHLLGYDDIEDQDRAIMRTKEQFHMCILREERSLLKP